MAKVAKFLLITGLGLAVLIAWVLSSETGRLMWRTAVGGFQKGQNQESVRRGQEMAARELRKQVPIQIDEITTLQSVIVLGKRVMYNNRIAMKTSDLDTDYFIEGMKKNLRYNICQHKVTVSFLDKGAIFMYAYFGSDGLLIGEISITSSTCPQ